LKRSPWWLVNKGREEAAAKALSRLGHSELSTEKHLAIMKVTAAAAREETEGSSFLECFRGTNLRRTIITIMPLTIQAMSGVAYISSYGTYYFELAGISTQKSFQIQCGAQALSIAGNIGAFLIIDRIGRRPLLLWAFGFLTVLLCVTGGLGTMTTNPSAVLGKCTVSLLS
jgi:MFS transporter, SP family, general alpha glucoside:H+ symporter